MLVFENSLNRNLNYPDLRCKTTRVYVLQKWYMISYLRSTWESQDVIYKNFCGIGLSASFEYYTIVTNQTCEIQSQNDYHQHFLSFCYEFFSKAQLRNFCEQIVCAIKCADKKLNVVCELFLFKDSNFNLFPTNEIRVPFNEA